MKHTKKSKHGEILRAHWRQFSEAAVAATTPPRSSEHSDILGVKQVKVMADFDSSSGDSWGVDQESEKEEVDKKLFVMTF